MQIQKIIEIDRLAYSPIAEEIQNSQAPSGDTEYYRYTIYFTMGKNVKIAIF